MAHSHPTPAASAPPVAPRSERREVWSPTLRRKVPVVVHLPAGYDGDSRHYPTVYVLHGTPGSLESVTDGLGVPAALDRLVATAQVPPMILVVPDGADQPAD